MYLNLTDLNLEPHNRNMSNMISPHDQAEWNFHPVVKVASPLQLLAAECLVTEYFSPFDRYFISKVTTKLNHLEHTYSPPAYL